MSFIEAHADRRTDDGLRWGVERTGTAAEGWLFHTGAGRPLPPSTVNSWWQSTVRAAGTPGLHLHGLRHFYASGLSPLAATW